MWIFSKVVKLHIFPTRNQENNLFLLEFSKSKRAKIF